MQPSEPLGLTRPDYLSLILTKGENMKQEQINHTNKGLSNISFQQKSTGLSLVITGSALLYFLANAWPMRPAAVTRDAIPAGYGGLVMTTLILVVAAQIVLQTVLAIGQGNVAPANVVEQAAALKAIRNAYFVLTATVLAAVGSVFVAALTPFDTANVIVVGLALAEIVQSVSQLLYTRR
ncbi:MAG: hypothetical protein KDE34_24715 [Anaerolineales bacterium]|nr:hypothetical protein [Anaerolineales bacterium]